MRMKKLMALAPLALAACLGTPPAGQQPALPQGSDGQIELTARECALYRAAAAQMAQDGQTVPRRLTRGCPDAETQSAADISPMVSPPPMMSGYPTTLHDQMRARGIPADLADQIARSKAFWDLVARRDSILAGF